jgi:GAF domain-containing protein
MPAASLSEALTALSKFLVADASLGETLHRVAELTLDAIPAAQVAGMSMLDERGIPTTAIYTDETSPKVDEAQYESGRGPCLSAWRDQRSVRIDDISVGDDYPEFRRAAADHGIHSTLSLPLRAADTGLGALNLYAPIPQGFSEADEAVGNDLATAASVVLANASAYWDAVELSQHMSTAMQSRSVIEQAKGMLMAQSPGLSADGAFDVLRKASQRENVKLRDVAQRIVDRRAPMLGEQG